MPVRLPLASAVLAALALGAPSAASAAPYEVKPCLSAASAAGLIVAEEGENDPSLGALSFECGPTSGGLRQRKIGEVHGGQRWALIAPQGTRLVHVSYERSVFHAGTSSMEWNIVAGGVRLFHFLDAGAGPPPDKAEDFAINSSFLRGDLVCPFAACPGGEIAVRLSNLAVVLEDEAFPILFGPLVPTTARGTARISYSATDLGSGIDKAALFVDGVESASAHDDNEGRCKPPFEIVTPCRDVVNSSFPLDTTRLPDGPHQVQVSVTDASGQETKSTAVTLTVHNAPTSNRRPAISGSAAPGGRLAVDTGGWEGNPTAFSYQWLRCPADVRLGDSTGCVAVDGAISSQYGPGSADIGKRDLVRVTATNAAGGGSTLSAPSDTVSPSSGKKRKPPVVSHVTLTRRRFRAATPQATAGRGTVLRFSSSKAGHLTLAIERLRHGKARPFAKLAAKIKSGRSSVLLNGLVGTRRMPPGRYRVVIRVKDAAGAISAPASIPFTIRPG